MRVHLHSNLLLVHVLLVAAVKPRANTSLLASVEINAITPYSISKHVTTKVKINQTDPVLAMLDSGSAGNFISPTVVQWLGLITQPRDRPLSVTHVQGRQVGQVTEQVICDMSIKGHSEEITFNVVPLGRHAIILGLPWLA